MDKDDQLSRVTDVDTTPPPEVAQDPQAPKMPFPTSYILTADQETELVQHAMKRLGELERQNGRDRGAHQDWWAGGGYGDAEPLDPMDRDRMDRTWLGKRRLFELIWENQTDYRLWTLGGIYRESNLTLPLARRITRQLIARGVSYFFGSDPWFAAYPVGEADRPLAERCDRFTRWKIGKAKLRQVLETAIERAFIIGECVVKSTWRKDVHYYQSDEPVMIGEDGQPVVDGTGNYITEDDIWVLPPAVEDPEQPGSGVTLPQTGLVLKRDMQTVKPLEPVFEKRLLTRRIQQYAGNHIATVNYGDFLNDLTAPSIQESDCCIHVYDQDVMEFADQWRRDQAEGDIPEESLENIRKAIELIQAMASSGTQRNTAQDADRPDEDTSKDRNADKPTAQIAEFYLRYDANGDGIMEDIILMIDRNTQEPIFYDYLANVTPDGLRPFSVVRVNNIANRWYGSGSIEMYEKMQNIVDLQLNRISKAQSEAGKVIFWNPALTLEGQADPGLRLNRGQTYTLANNATKPDEVLSVVYLDDIKSADLNKFMELFMQMAMNESGVMNANDGQVAGLESSKLATGIRNIEKSGNELFGLFVGHLEPGIADALEKNVRIMMANLDDSEVYRYFEEGEGGAGAGAMVEISAADIPDLDMDVQVLLTRSRGEQLLASCSQAIELVNAFYAQPYEIQLITAKFYRDMLRALQVMEPEKSIVPTMPLAPPAMPGQPTGGGNPNLPAPGATPSTQPPTAPPTV